MSFNLKTDTSGSEVRWVSPGHEMRYDPEAVGLNPSWVKLGAHSLPVFVGLEHTKKLLHDI